MSRQALVIAIVNEIEGVFSAARTTRPEIIGTARASKVEDRLKIGLVDETGGIRSGENQQG